MSTGEGEGAASKQEAGAAARTTPFRFKRRHRHGHNGKDTTSRTRRSARDDHHGHRHHHRSKRHKSTAQTLDDPSEYDDSVSELPSDVAFRESLFDAMGDDEGAAFWQSVYGQPIHTYPKAYQDEVTGELESMNDDEYAQYVRQRMWEKSREGVEAARESKRLERKRERQRQRNYKEHEPKQKDSRPQQEADYPFDLDIEKSLRRGQRRQDSKRWKARWLEYLGHWDELNALRESDRSVQKGIFLRNKIDWPVESGKRKDLNPAEIERFVRECAEATDGSDSQFQVILKAERVRWHPDKIQQRYGSLDIDETTTQGVTAVFQVLDQMWSEYRDRTS